MNNNAWFKKEIPLQTVIGFGGGATGFGAHSSSATKTYVDDVFSTNVWIGNETARTISTGVDNNKGALAWVKSRNDTHDYHLVDTVRGANQLLYSNSSAVQSNTANRITAFTNDGYTLGTAGQVNGTSAYNYAGWNFRKKEGFFDIVTYTGTGSAQNISHNLGCVPGMILIKCTTNGYDWAVYHRQLGNTKTVWLNYDQQEVTSSTYWNDTNPTSSQFTVGSSNHTNLNGATFIAYVFAGGESSADTARSVNFTGSGGTEDYLTIADHADFDFATGDFTIEFWMYMTSNSSNNPVIIGSQSGWYFQTKTGDTVLSFYTGVTEYTSTSTALTTGCWHHIAISRSGTSLKVFVDGKARISQTDSDNVNLANTLNIGRFGAGSLYFTGKLSNVRVVKGTAVYTTDFKPPTEPLTNITNTKLLCCNDSSATGSTVTPGTITANNSPTVSTDSPFDDPDGFKFGADSDNLEGIIKTGSYVGNSTANHEIYLGWEPQYWLVKNVTDNSSNWQLLDSIRGWIVDGNDQYFAPNNNSADSAFNFGNPTPTGFNLSNASSNWQNASGKTYIYMAIRRPDGVVGKPPSAATDVFTMVAGDDTVQPSFAANFNVDFSFTRKPVSSYGMVNINRLTGTNEMFFYNDDVTAGADGDYALDYNNGFAKNRNNTYQSWMWKRSAGMDVVYDYITGSTGYKGIRHNLNAIPEMIIVKSYTGTDDDWIVYNKYLNGGTNSNDYYLALNKSDEENSVSGWLEATPTATSFSLQTNYRYTGWHSFQLFASANDADGNPISKVGTYVGDGTTNGSKVITLGFEPRFILIKGVDNGTHNWDIFDSIRGFGAGVATNYLQLNTSTTQGNAGTGLLEKSTTSFTVGCNGVSGWNSNGRRHIYYAHA
jgi:hypothetical protein